MFNVNCKMKNVYYPFTDSNLSARNTVRGDTGRAGLGRHAGLPLQAYDDNDGNLRECDETVTRRGGPVCPPETPHGHILNYKF